MRTRIKKKIRQSVIWCFLLAFLAIMYFPVYWLVTMSFKREVDIASSTPVWIFKPIIRNYQWIFKFGEILNGLRISLIVATTSTVVACVLGIPAAYVFARLKFSRRDDLEFWVLTTRMLPPIAILVPYVAIWIKLGLYNTIPSIIITHLVVNLPLVLWLSSRFIEQVPREVEEAALLDGCSRLSAIYRIIFPLAASGLMVAAIFAFIFSWNEYFFAFVLGPTARTLPVVVASYISHGHEVLWGQMSAAAIIACIPALILTIIARNSVVKGFKFMGGLR